MSDLLSPILSVMDNEVEAFWCFVSFMDQMVSSGASVHFSQWRVCGLAEALLISSAVYVFEQHQNFEEQMQGMKTQLIQLSTLLRLLDLAFWNYLGVDQSSRGAVCLLMASSHLSFLPLQSLKIPVTSISASAGC